VSGSFSGFLAKGYIDNLPCSIIGHISTLNIFCAYEAGRGKTRVGFILDQSEVTSDEGPIEDPPEPPQT
jgi:hypothetical protein